MVLVAHRDTANSTAASFVSHAFRNLQGAAAAVVDAYRGRPAPEAKIMDGSHVLPFNAEAALQPGGHQLSLVLGEGNATAPAGPAVPLEVSQGMQDRYLVMRVGGAEGNGTAFPQEIMALALPR